MLAEGQSSNLICQPGMRLQTLLGPISVIVEKFFSGGDFSFGDQDQSRSSLEHDRLGLQVGRHPGMVDQTSETAALFRGVDAEIRLIEVLRKHIKKSISILY